jgi:hypothetical protein
MERVVVPPPCPGLDMAAGYGWVQSSAIRAFGNLKLVLVQGPARRRRPGLIEEQAHACRA